MQFYKNLSFSQSQQQQKMKEHLHLDSLGEQESKMYTLIRTNVNSACKQAADAINNLFSKK